MTLEGRRMEEGQMWHDGCRRCFCYQGKEMCTLIDCPVPKCPNPFMRSGDCCLTCGGEMLTVNGLNVLHPTLQCTVKCCVISIIARFNVVERSKLRCTQPQ